MRRRIIGFLAWALVLLVVPMHGRQVHMHLDFFHTQRFVRRLVDVILWLNFLMTVRTALYKIARVLPVIDIL
jgi:hypothetical protein